MVFFPVSLSFPWHYCFPKTLLFKVCLRSKRMEDWAMGWCSADSFLSLWKSFKKTVPLVEVVCWFPPRMDKDKDEPLTGARDASFKHYCSCYPGGKPTYNLKLSKEAGRFKDSKTGFGGLPGPPPFRSCVEVFVRLGVRVQDLWRYEYTIYSIYT